MKHILLFSLACIALCPFAAKADTDDETLSYYLSKSDTVIRGKIGSKLFRMVTEGGAPIWFCDYEVTEVLKGDVKLVNTTVMVKIRRFENNEEDRHPLIEKGSESILFLKTSSGKPALETADFWFGVQHPNTFLTFRIKVLEAERLGNQKLVQEIIEAEHRRLNSEKKTEKKSLQ